MKGTSILILAPELGSDDLHTAARRAIDILLWFCWPKLISDASADYSPMRFAVEVNEEELDVPSPEDCPPFNLYAEALRNVRTESGDSLEIRSHRPGKHLGRLHLTRGLRKERPAEIEIENSLLPAFSSHVALMRPAELVVKYIQGEPLPSEDVEWGGVFVCSAEHEVEQAFAAAEPPAHDDWDPRSLPRGASKTFVNVALTRIKEHMTRYTANLVGDPVSGGARTSLGSVADTLGALLTGTGGSRLGANTGGRRAASRGQRHAVTISRPVFVGHDLLQGKYCALFRVTVSCNEPVRFRLEGSARILRDGGGSDASDSRGARAEVLGWRMESGESFDGAWADLSLDDQTTLTAIAAIPNGKAISFSTSFEVLG